MSRVDSGQGMTTVRTYSVVISHDWDTGTVPCLTPDAPTFSQVVPTLLLYEASDRCVQGGVSSIQALTSPLDVI